MAEADKILFDLLTNDVDVSAIISNRMYPIQLPQESLLPADTYQRSSVERPATVDEGPIDCRFERIQLDLFSNSFSNQRDLAVKIRNLLDGNDGTYHRGIFIDTERDMFYDDAMMFRTIIDVMIPVFD